MHFLLVFNEFKLKGKIRHNSYSKEFKASLKVSYKVYKKYIYQRGFSWRNAYF